MGFQQGSNDISKQLKPSIDFIHQTFEDTKGVIRSRKEKDRKTNKTLCELVVVVKRQLSNFSAIS